MSKEECWLCGNGKKLKCYEVYCGNCHKTFRLVEVKEYPPVSNTPWLERAGRETPSFKGKMYRIWPVYIAPVLFRHGALYHVQFGEEMPDDGWICFGDLAAALQAAEIPPDKKGGGDGEV